MSDKVNGTVKQVIDNNTAIIRVVSYGYYNKFNYENRNELVIEFTNLQEGHTVNELADNPLEITIDAQPTNLNEPIRCKGKIIRIIDSEIFI